MGRQGALDGLAQVVVDDARVERQLEKSGVAAHVWRRKEIESLMNAFELPAGYSWSWDDRILEQVRHVEADDAAVAVAATAAYLRSGRSGNCCFKR